MDEKKQETVTYDQTMHQYVFKPIDGTTCGQCNVAFSDHFHKVPFLAKVLASIDKRYWKNCTWQVREKYRAEASAWLAEQQRRLNV